MSPENKSSTVQLIAATIAGNSSGARCNLATHVHEKLQFQDFSISQRHEATGASEFTFIALTYGGFEVPGLVYTINGQNTKIEITESRKVSKDDVNNNTTQNLSFPIFSPNQYTNPYCFDFSRFQLAMPAYYLREYYGVGAYEKDWYQGAKRSFTIRKTLNGNPEDFGGNRKFTNDWYFWNPDNNFGYDFTARHPNNNSVYTNTNRGVLHLKREYQ